MNIDAFIIHGISDETSLNYDNDHDERILINNDPTDFIVKEYFNFDDSNVAINEIKKVACFQTHQFSRTGFCIDGEILFIKKPDVV